MGRTILVFEMFTITASVEPSVYWYVPQVHQALYGRVLTSGNDTSQEEGSQLDENEIISKLSNSAITGAIAVR